MGFDDLQVSNTQPWNIFLFKSAAAPAPERMQSLPGTAIKELKSSDNYRFGNASPTFLIFFPSLFPFIKHR